VTNGAHTYWDKFYLRNETRFFKDRHYLERDFPQLLQGGGGVGADADGTCADATGAPASPRRPFTLLEFGCGVGNAFFPLVERLPHLHVTAFDLSANAMEHIAAHPAHATGRVCAFAFDAGGSVMAAVQRAHAEWLRAGEALAAAASSADGATAPSAGAAASGVAVPAAGVVTVSGLRRRGAPRPTLAPGQLLIAAPSAPPPPVNAATALSSRPLLERGFDAVLMLFMLSAMPPAAHAAIWAQAAAALAPGGVLLFRDYGRYDEAQLRFPGKQRVGPNLYARSDGTLSYFFSLGGWRAQIGGGGRGRLSNNSSTRPAGRALTNPTQPTHPLPPRAVVLQRTLMRWRLARAWSGCPRPPRSGRRARAARQAAPACERRGRCATCAAATATAG
jgi:SAM-dependent methyltransferase